MLLSMQVQTTWLWRRWVLSFFNTSEGIALARGFVEHEQHVGGVPPPLRKIDDVQFVMPAIYTSPPSSSVASCPEFELFKGPPPWLGPYCHTWHSWVQPHPLPPFWWTLAAISRRFTHLTQMGKRPLWVGGGLRRCNGNLSTIFFQPHVPWCGRPSPICRVQWPPSAISTLLIGWMGQR